MALPMSSSQNESAAFSRRLMPGPPGRIAA